MAAKECIICKHYGKSTKSATGLERAVIFDDGGTPIPILLCRHHSVQLFKYGQKRFLLGHYQILVDIISSDETKFLEILEKTVRNNLDDIY